MRTVAGEYFVAGSFSRSTKHGRSGDPDSGAHWSGAPYTPPATEVNVPHSCATNGSLAYTGTIAIAKIVNCIFISDLLVLSTLFRSLPFLGTCGKNFDDSRTIPCAFTGTIAPAFASPHDACIAITHLPSRPHVCPTTYAPGVSAAKNLSAIDFRSPFTIPSAVPLIARVFRRAILQPYRERCTLHRGQCSAAIVFPTAIAESSLPAQLTDSPLAAQRSSPFPCQLSFQCFKVVASNCSAFSRVTTLWQRPSSTIRSNTRLSVSRPPFGESRCHSVSVSRTRAQPARHRQNPAFPPEFEVELRQRIAQSRRRRLRSTASRAVFLRSSPAHCVRGNQPIRARRFQRHPAKCYACIPSPALSVFIEIRAAQIAPQELLAGVLMKKIVAAREYSRADLAHHQPQSLPIGL